MDTMLVRAGDPFPADYSVIRALVIESIRATEIERIENDAIDITSLSSPVRQHVTAMSGVLLKTGRFIRLSPAELNAALQGGGNFWYLQPNGDQAPMTLEQHEEYEERLAEIDNEYW